MGFISGFVSATGFSAGFITGGGWGGRVGGRISRGFFSEIAGVGDGDSGRGAGGRDGGTAYGRRAGGAGGTWGGAGLGSYFTFSSAIAPAEGIPIGFIIIGSFAAPTGLPAIVSTEAGTLSEGGIEGGDGGRGAGPGAEIGVFISGLISGSGRAGIFSATFWPSNFVGAFNKPSAHAAP